MPFRTSQHTTVPEFGHKACLGERGGLSFLGVSDFLGLFESRNFLGFSVFLLFFQVFLVWKGIKIPWCFGWFSLVLPKSKEWKIRAK